MFHVLKMIWKLKVWNNISSEVGTQSYLQYFELHVSIFDLGG